MKVDPREEEEAGPATAEAEQLALRSRKVNFLEAGRANFKQTLREAADWKALRKTPYGLKPALVLTAISVIYSFDGGAFLLLAPDIIKDLEIRLQNVINALYLVGLIGVFLTIGVGYLSDRRRRIPIVGSLSAISGVFSLFTGRSNTSGTIGATRAGDIVGKGVTVPAISSLLADYYPPESRGKVYALSGTLGRAATLFSPLAIAYLAATTSWRVPFFLFGSLLILVGLMAVVLLREPIRGYMERKAQGASEEVAMTEDEPPSLGESWRTIWSIRTLRRFFIANVFDNVADLIFSLFFVIFLFEHYGLGLVERAWIGVFAGVFRIGGGFIGGGIVDSLTRRRPQRVLVFLGLLAITSSFALLAVVLAPPLWVLIVFFAVFGFFSALLGPASGVIYAQILPPHIRSTGLAVQGISLIPALILATYAINAFLDRWGVQGLMQAAVPFAFVAGIIQLSAAGFFERDMRSALAAAIASEEWRRAKSLGRGKLLVCRDVDVEYDGVQVLFGVDFDVEEGEIIALLGTNGAGKSTLLRAISGTQEASSGAIVFDGRDITHMPPHEIASRGIVHMPGGRGLFPGLTVKENLRLGNWLTDPDQETQRLSEVFEIFPVLRDRQSDKAGLLSGGEQQMLSLAQAFLSRPRLLMIDELSLGLAPSVVQELTKIVKEIHKRGVTIIIVEQSVNVALTIAERAIFMEKGEVRFIGRTSDLLGRPDILRAVYVKGTAALTALSPGSALKSEKELREYELSHSRPVLEVKGVSKDFGGIKAVSRVSLTLREGEALGLIGPNGAGKTTLFDLISGYQIPDEGEVIFDGTDVTHLRADEKANLGIARRFQDARMFPALTVYENLLVALDRKLESRNMALTALQLPSVRQSERRVRLRAERIIELLELGAYRDKFVRELSTGLRRIVDLACVLAVEPKVLMLDEPSTGIAQAETEGLGPLLRRVRFETGCSMLVIEHSMGLISSISDELIALEQGLVITRGTPDEVLNDERVIQSYLGTSEDIVEEAAKAVRPGKARGK